MRRVNLLHAHGSPTQYLYSRGECRCVLCRSEHAHYQRLFRTTCPEKTAENNRRYNAKNHTKVVAQRRRYYADHREEIHQQRASRREEMVEYDRLYRATHRDERRAYNAAYDAAHPGEATARWRNYKARRRGASGSHTVADVLAQYARQKGRCFWGRKANPECAVSLKSGYHIDHVTPLVKKGSNGTENIVLSCPSCNLRKAAKHPMDFAGRMF